MPQSPQTQAISVVNDILSYAQQVMTLYYNIKSIDARWTDDNVSFVLSQLHTTPVNIDGSISTVNDVAPIQTNPINILNYPTLTRPISLQQITQAKTVLDGLASYIDGLAVTTNPGARAIIDAAIGG